MKQVEQMLKQLSPATVAVALTDESELKKIESILAPYGIGVIRLQAGFTERTLRDVKPQVLICEHHPNRQVTGIPTWKGLLSVACRCSWEPKLIVTSRLADPRLWSEVLNFGAHDLLALPFERTEVLRVIMHALQSSPSFVN